MALEIYPGLSSRYRARDGRIVKGRFDVFGRIYFGVLYREPEIVVFFDEVADLATIKLDPIRSCSTTFARADLFKELILLGLWEAEFPCSGWHLELTS